MTNPNMVNIGTKENPVLVPETDIEPGTVKGEQYWSRVATGSQNPPNESVFKSIKQTPNGNDVKKS